MVLTIGCQICKENFSSIAIFKTHLNTRLHNQMFSQVFLNASVGYNVPFTGFPNIVFVTQSSRRQTRKRPILGLSYITLCFSHTCPGAFYLCHICQETCPLGKILNHVFGIEHISSYFAYTDPDALSFAWIASMIFITEKSRAIAEQKKDNFNLQLLHLSENLLTQCQNENYSTVMNLLHQNKNLSNLLSVYDANIPQIKSLLSYRDDVKRQNPLLGLQHLVECVCPGPNEKKHYICTLCSTHASPKNIIKHVLSFAHVYKYFKAWHPSTPMPNESYTKYNTKFKSRMLHFAKQSEAIYGTAGVQQVTLQPADFTAVPHSSIEIAIKMIEIVTKKKEGSLIPVVKPGPKLEPNKSRKEVTLSNKPEEPAAQVMPYSLYCQNCSRKFDTDTLYSNHLSMSRHQEMYYIVFGGDANDSSSQSNKSLALLSIPCFGASLIVTILSHHLRDQQFYICFACETCIYSPGLLHHIHSKKHFIRVLMYQNPWRLPFGWKNGLDYHSLKRQVYEEEEQRGPEQKTMKILDVPAHIFKNVLNLDFPKVIEQFNLYHTQLLNAVPHCETFSKLKDNERFPLLGRDFLVKYGHMKTGWKFLCLLCERTLSADEYNGHVFSWEHVVAFLENVHPGSLDTNIANEETLLDLAKQAARIHRVLNEQEIIMFQGSFVHVSDYLTKIRQLSNEKARDGNGPLKPTITPQMKLVPRQKDATMNNLPAQGETAEKLDIADQENAKETEITTEVSDGQTEEALEICLQEESEEPMLNIAIEQEVDGLNPQPECSVEGVTYHENTKTPDGQNVEPMESCLQEKSDHQVQQVTFKQEVDGSNPVAGPVVVVNDNEKNNNDGESMDNKALKRPCSMLEEDHSTSETGEADPKRMRLSEPEEKDKLVNNQNRDAIGDCSLGDQAETNTVPSSCPEKLWMYVQSKIREPLIGLNALYECCCDDQAPVYLCECCRLIIKEEQIITHLNNHWHYRNYLQSVKADSLTQDKNWREKIVKFAAYWERTEGYGDPQAVELTTEDYVKISAGFEWYKAFQIVRAQMAKDENIKNLDVNNVGTAAEESQDERQQCAKLEMDLEPQISPDPATTSENTEAISNPDSKTEQHADINLAKVEEPIDSDVTKSSEALTELVCSPHNLVTNTFTTPTITTPALSSSIQSTVNPEVETASMVQEDTDLKIENIISPSCPTDAMDTPKPSEPVCKFVKLTRTVPSFAITQPTPPPIPTSIPASSCTSVVVSNAISPDSSKAEDYTSISSILKTTEDAAKSQVCVFTMGSKVQSHLSKPQEESNVIFESTAAVPCEDKMSAIKLTTVPSETIMALSVVNGDAIISTKPTKNNNQLKLKVDVASNNPQEEGNDKFTPSTPNCELQMTELPQKSTAGSKIAGQDGESNVTTEKNKPATTECSLHSNKKPTPKPPQRTTQCPKIGSDQLIKVSCEGRWQFYCFACQTSVESTNHLISASHQMNCVKIKFPWWTTNPPLNDMVALMADDEKALKPVPKKIEVSSEVYKELKALKGLKAVERIRGMEKHKSGSKNAVNPRPLVSENEEPRSSPSEISLSPYQATSPVLAGQDKSETKSREETSVETSVETIKKRPVLSESAPKTSSKTQKPTSKVPPRITGATTGNSSNLSKFLKVRAIDKPVIGLCLIWECRVVSQGPPKTFYLCESCSKTLTVSEIMEHMPSTEHQWNYMIKQYPRFMYWKDEELLPEMSAELTNSIAGWVSGREESMDAQAVLLSEDYYERVRTASFVEALNFLHMIRESKKATLPLFDVEGELGEDQTLDSLKNPVTDVREQLKRFVLQKAEEDSDSDDAKQETANYYELHATSLNTDIEPCTNSKDRTPPNITYPLTSQLQKYSSLNPSDSPDVSSYFTMEHPDSKIKTFKDGHQLVENVATVASHLAISQCLKNTIEDADNETYNEIYSPSSPVWQSETSADEETEKCLPQTSSDSRNVVSCANPTFSEGLKDINQNVYNRLCPPCSPACLSDTPLEEDTEKCSLQTINSAVSDCVNPAPKGLKDMGQDIYSEIFSPILLASQLHTPVHEDREKSSPQLSNVSATNQTTLSDHTKQDLYDGTYYYSPSLPTCQPDSPLRPDVQIASIDDKTNKCSETNTDSTEVSTANTAMALCSADSNNTENVERSLDEPVMDIHHIQMLIDLVKETKYFRCQANQTSTTTKSDTQICQERKMSRWDVQGKLKTDTVAAHKDENMLTEDHINISASTSDNVSVNAGVNTSDNDNSTAKANTSSEDYLSIDAEKPGSAKKTSVSSELQSLWIGSLKTIEDEVSKEEFANELHSQFHVQPLKIQAQQPLIHLQKVNLPEFQGKNVTQTKEVPLKSLEVCVNQSLNRLQQSEMKVAQSQNMLQLPESQTLQTPTILQLLGNQVMPLEPKITPLKTSTQQVLMSNSSAKLPIPSTITSTPHQGSHGNFMDYRNNQTFLNLSLSQVNQGFQTTNPTPCPTSTMPVPGQFVQTTYSTNTNIGYMNSNNVAQYVATQAPAYSNQIYHPQQQIYSSMQSYGQNVQNQNATILFNPLILQLQPGAQPFSAWTNQVGETNNVTYVNMGQISAPNIQAYTNVITPSKRGRKKNKLVVKKQ